MDLVKVFVIGSLHLAVLSGGYDHPHSLLLRLVDYGIAVIAPVGDEPDWDDKALLNAITQKST